MAKPADRAVSLTELRFKPANSNDAARAVLAHHFNNVPRCSFARDDGISHYLSAETGMDTFPALPDRRFRGDADVPAIEAETPEKSGNLRRKILRGGFALSVFLHAVAAIAIGYATLALPEEAALEEGVTSVSIIVDGDSNADTHISGEDEEIEAPDDKPVTKPVEKVVEKQPEPVKQPVIEQLIPATAEAVLKDLPIPELGAALPEILTARDETRQTTDPVAKAVPAMEKVEPLPEKIAERAVVEKPVKKPEAKKEPEADKPVEKTRKKKGNRGNQAIESRRGDVDSSRDGKASLNSRGDSQNKETGNASRTQYKGLIQRKLARAKGRAHVAAKGSLTVVFTIRSDGSVTGLRVTQSSGKPALDAAAVKIVQAAAPFPHIPADAGRKSWPMTVPMTFK